MPVHQGYLTGDSSGSQPIKILKDFQQISAMFITQCGGLQIIEDQHLGFGQCIRQFQIANLTLSEGQLTEDTRHPGIEVIEAVTIALIPKGSSVSCWA